MQGHRLGSHMLVSMWLQLDGVMVFLSPARRRQFVAFLIVDYA